MKSFIKSAEHTLNQVKGYWSNKLIKEYLLLKSESHEPREKEWANMALWKIILQKTDSQQVELWLSF